MVTTPPSVDTTKSIDFEATLEKLQYAVKRLESGELSLDQALSQFEEGVRLSKACHEYLAAAEQKVELLTKADRTSSPS